MTHRMKAICRDKAKELAKEYNPYIKKSTAYYIDGKPMYIYADGKSYTKEELDAAYEETATKDMISGYEQRMVGYYDKWYRYNHADEGRAYDVGVRMATERPKCKGECHYIECMC